MGDVLSVAVTELASSGSLAAIQQCVRAAARTIARADGATFVLRDLDMCFYADEDAISPLWKGQRFPMQHCISGWAMLHHETAMVPDIELDERIPIEAYRPTFVKSLAMLPVGKSGDKADAAIGVYWSKPHTPPPAVLDALSVLAAATSDAIDRVGLAEAPFTVRSLVPEADHSH